MKLLLLMLFLASCSENIIDSRTVRTKTSDFIVVGRAEIKATVTYNHNLSEASTPTTVTFVVAEAKVFNVDVSNISPIESGEVLDLGTLDISNTKVNKLKKCGINADQKCTQAIVRIFTTELVGYEGITGFVNTDELYGVDVLAGEGTANLAVGLTDTNAAIVDSYTIPAGDRRLSVSDFNGMSYDVEVDFSNAGVGSYEMTLVIELALAL